MICNIGRHCSHITLSLEDVTVTSRCHRDLQDRAVMLRSIAVTVPEPIVVTVICNIRHHCSHLTRYHWKTILLLSASLQSVNTLWPIKKVLLSASLQSVNTLWPIKILLLSASLQSVNTPWPIKKNLLLSALLQSVNMLWPIKEKKKNPNCC